MTFLKNSQRSVWFLSNKTLGHNAFEKISSKSSIIIHSPSLQQQYTITKEWENVIWKKYVQSFKSLAYGYGFSQVETGVCIKKNGYLHHWTVFFHFCLILLCSITKYFPSSSLQGPLVDPCSKLPKNSVHYNNLRWFDLAAALMMQE